jgi:hypothetical protein
VLDKVSGVYTCTICDAVILDKYSLQVRDRIERRKKENTYFGQCCGSGSGSGSPLPYYFGSGSYWPRNSVVYRPLERSFRWKYDANNNNLITFKFSRCYCMNCAGTYLPTHRFYLKKFCVGCEGPGHEFETAINSVVVFETGFRLCI